MYFVSVFSNILIFLFVLSLILFSGSVVGAVYSKRRFEEMLPITVTALMLILFLFGCMGILEAGVYFVIALCAVAYILCAIRIVKKKNFRQISSRLFTPGTLLFFLSCAVLLLQCFGKHVLFWDELSHWALTVRSMVYYGALSTGATSGTIFQNYPPAMALFQYLLMRLNALLGGQPYDEWLLYYAYQLFALSFCFPFLRSFPRRKLPQAIVLLALFKLAPMVFFEAFHDSLFIDSFLGLVAGCGWAWLLLAPQEDRRYSCLFVCCCISTLVLAKEVGFLLAVFLAAGFCVRFRSSAVIEGSKQNRRKWIFISAPFVAAGLPKLLWENHLIRTHAVRQFSAPVDLRVLADVLLGRDLSYRSQALAAYGKNWLDGSKSFGFFSVNVSYLMQCLLLFAGISFLLWAFRKFHHRALPAARSIVLLLLVQQVVYSLGLAVMYLFKFEPVEALILASFSRYTSIPYLLLLIVCCLLLVHLLIGSRLKSLLALVLFVLLCIPGETLQASLSGKTDYEKTQQWLLYENGTKELRQAFPDHTQIFFLAQGDEGTLYHNFRYHLFPRIPVQKISWSLGPPGSSDDFWSEDISPSYLQSVLKESYDYVFVAQSDSVLAEHFSSVLQGIEPDTSFALFAVDRDSGQAHLLREHNITDADGK